MKMLSKVSFIIFLSSCITTNKDVKAAKDSASNKLSKIEEACLDVFDSEFSKVLSQHKIDISSMVERVNNFSHDEQ